MRFHYAESMTDPAYYPELARCAEEHGFHGMTVPDSICYPEHSDSTYPYNADGTREFLDDKPFIEPFCLISALGMVTTTLTFTTFVIKLPLRHPVNAAKSTASVAALTGGRLLLGVGSSPWPDDYEVIGLPWSERGRRMDECVEIVRGLTTGGYFAYAGRHYTVPSIKITPAAPGPVPILLGGHTPPALRRAARLGDGWMFAGGRPDELPGLLAELARLRAEAGRGHEPFSVYAGSLEGYTPDGVRRLEDMGVTDVVVGFRDPYVAGPDTQPLAEKKAAIAHYAETVLAKVGA